MKKISSHNCLQSELIVTQPVQHLPLTMSLLVDDLVSGDTYQYQIKIHDSGNATIASSNLTTFTATSTIQSLGTWSYSTPNASGTYCASTYLYSQSGTQLIGKQIALC